MKRTDKYPPPTPEDVARVAAHGSTRKVHPLLWVVLVVVLVMGVGLYSDLVGFYEFEDIEEIISDDEHEDGDAAQNDKADSDRAESDKADHHGQKDKHED